VNPEERRSINTVRVRTPSRMVALPWESARGSWLDAARGRGRAAQRVVRGAGLGDWGEA